MFEILVPLSNKIMHNLDQDSKACPVSPSCALYVSVALHTRLQSVLPEKVNQLV